MATLLWKRNSKKISDENRQIILEEISSKWCQRSYGDIRDIDNGIESQKLALYIGGELLDYKKIRAGFPLSKYCLAL